MNLIANQTNNSGLMLSNGGAALASLKKGQYTHSHLKFHLGDQLALLPTSQVLEAITVPAASLTPMPNMPPAMLGLINRRSQVLWVADLAMLLGIPVAYPYSQQYNLVLLQVNHVLLGLRVQDVEGILSLPPENICEAPAHVPAGLVPFLRGCFLQNNDVLLVLSAEAVLRAPALQPN